MNLYLNIRDVDSRMLPEYRDVDYIENSQNLIDSLDQIDFRPHFIVVYSLLKIIKRIMHEL